MSTAASRAFEKAAHVRLCTKETSSTHIRPAPRDGNDDDLWLLAAAARRSWGDRPSDT